MRRIIGILVICLLLAVVVEAQPTGGGPGNGGDPDVPFDGAIGLLIAAGAYLGIRRLKGPSKGKNKSSIN